MEHKGAAGPESTQDFVQDGTAEWEMIGEHNGDQKRGGGGGGSSSSSNVAFAVKGRVKCCTLSLWDGPSELLRLSLDDLSASISEADVSEAGSKTWVFHASVQDLQLDNYYEQAMYLVVVAKEWARPEELHASPAIRFSAVQRIGSAATIVFFESITLEISKMTVQLDLTTLNRMLEWYRQWAEKDSYVDEDSIGNHSDAGFLKDVDDYTVYIEKMCVPEVKGVFNFTVGQGDDVSEIRPDTSYLQKSLGWVAGNIQGYRYKSDEFTITHESLTKPEIKHRLITHYTNAIMSPRERLRIFGSAAALGNPSGFFGSIGSGIDAFEQERKSGGGVGRGLESLAAHTAKGALGSLASVTGTMSKGLSSITLDDVYITQQEDGHKQRPANLKSGVSSGMMKFRQGFVDAVTGVVTKPYEGAQQDGLRGLAEGGVQGFLGLVCKPMVGVLNAVTDSAHGMNQTITRRASIGHVLERRPTLGSWGDSCGIDSAPTDADAVQSSVQRPSGNFLDRQGSIFLMDRAGDVIF
jgi:vacuolar protein sorting-associated protein 13A/C